MAVRLRLKRFGRRHRPVYRLTAVDGRRARDGRVIEEIGFYDPVTQDETRKLTLKRERIEYWLSVGAQPSDTVRNLLHKNGFDIKPVVRPTKPRKEEPKPEPSEDTGADASGEPAQEASAQEAAGEESSEA